MKSTLETFLELREPGVSLLEHVRIATPYIALRSVIGDLSVLDVGTGPGYASLVASLAEPRLLVTCDVDSNRLPSAEGLSGPGAPEACLMDACSLGFRSQSFDTALMFEVIEHVATPSDALRELRRAVREKGLAFLTTPNRRTRLLPFEPPTNPEHLREWTPEKFGEQLRREFHSVRLLGIYGEEPFQSYFLNDWRPSLLRVYRRTLRPLLTRFIPEDRLRRLTESLRPARPSGDVEEKIAPEAAFAVEVESLQPDTWPFFVAADTVRCLSVFAICGNDGAEVNAAAERVVSSFGGRSSTGTTATG